MQNRQSANRGRHLFVSRPQAAEELARQLQFLRPEEPIVLGLPNEGVQVAETVARALDAPMDVLLVEWLAFPGNERGNDKEMAGVVDEFGRISMIENSARWHHVSSQQMIEPARAVFRQLQRKRGRIRAILPALDIANRTVLIVDQGVATGARMLGAIASVRDRGARKVIVAAPAGAGRATWKLHEAADHVVIPHRPSKFDGIEQFYEHYLPVPDELLLACLEKWVTARDTTADTPQTLIMKLANDAGRLLSCEVDLPTGTRRNGGPHPAVIFAHGFESTAQSPRSVPISRRLANRGVIGVRFDFTGHGRSEGRLEEATDLRMFDDLVAVVRNVLKLSEVDPTRIGLCGSGTGGLLALRLAAGCNDFAALVIRGPICGNEINAASTVSAPTLLVHAERDTALSASIELIDRSLDVQHELLRIPDSNRLFDDPISRELMIDASVSWLTDHLRDGRSMPEIEIVARERSDSPSVSE